MLVYFTNSVARCFAFINLFEFSLLDNKFKPYIKKSLVYVLAGVALKLVMAL